jgi:hypothetical protein
MPEFRAFKSLESYRSIELYKRGQTFCGSCPFLVSVRVYESYLPSNEKVS